MAPRVALAQEQWAGQACLEGGAVPRGLAQQFHRAEQSDCRWITKLVPPAALTRMWYTAS